MINNSQTGMYTRSSGFFNSENQRFNLKIFGVGSLGSFLTLNLAKLGFSNISIFDYDKIELHNIPNQFYRMGDIGKFKVEALQSIVKDFSNIDINIRNTKILPQNVAELASEIDLNSLIVLCFDNMEARKLIFKQFIGYPNYLIDLRMGGKNWSIETVKLDNPEECKEYEISLNKPTIDLECGMQSIIFNILNVVSEASHVITHLNNNEPYKRLIKRSMNSYMFLSK